MDECKPLLGREIQNNESEQKCIGTKSRVLIYVIINSIALCVSGSAQTQYIYAYLKEHDASNKTDRPQNNNISDKNCGNSTTSDVGVQAQASQWNWYITLVEFGITIPIIIFAGPLVDRIGRKPVLLYNTAVMFISFVVKSIVIYFKMNLYFFMIGSGIEGLSGTFFVFHSASLSIIADTTTKGKDRTWVMVIYDGMMGVGAFLSYVGTGYLIQFEGYLYPFIISSAMFLVFFLIIAATLNDPWKPPENETNFGICNFAGQICSLWVKRESMSLRLNHFICYILMLLFTILPMVSYSSIRTILTLGWPFCWSAEHIGWYNAATDLVIFLFGAVVLKIMHSFCLFLKDEWIVIFGFMSSIACFVLLGIANTDWIIYGATVVSIIRVLPIPLIKAILSRTIHQENQGVLFSNIYLIEAGCTLGGSTLFNNIYDHTVYIYKGLVFFIMAGFPLVAIILMMAVICTNTPKLKTEVVIDKTSIQQPD